jgi:hypothetical protein
MADRGRVGVGRVRNLAVFALLTGAPLAQPLAQTQTAGGFEQLGIRTEMWNIFPSIGLSTQYNDNVFAVPDDEEPLEEDIIFVVSPRVVAEANTQRHALAVSAGASIGRYVEQTDQNFNDFDVGVSGRWDVSRTFDVSASFEFARAQEDQTDPDRSLDRALRTETTTIDNFSGNLVASKDWQRWFARARTGVVRRTFSELDATLFDPGTGDPTGQVNVNADRDLYRIPFGVRVGYDVDRDYNVFLDINYTVVRYDENEQDLTFAPFLEVRPGQPPVVVNRPVDVTEGDDQDFENLSFRVGTGVDFDRLVSGDFAVGVDRRFGDQEGDELGFSFDANLDWTVSPRTSVNFTGSQGFEPATGGDAGGSSLKTRLGVDVNYALTRQVSLGGRVAYLRDDRSNGGRTDDDVTTGVSASYAINRYASIAAGYEYRQRTSTDADREFTRNLVFLTLTGQY